MTKEKPEWEKLELVVAELQKQLAPKAEVHQNHHIIGKSGRRRKLDIAVSQKVGTYPILIVFDCKRHKGPVKMKHIESFAGQVEDVKANLGVMISNSGFDAGAKAVAIQKNIILQTYRKAREADWSDTVGEKAWVFLTRVEIAQVKATALLEQSTSPAEVPFNVLLFDEKREVLDNLRDLFWKIWKASESPHNIGEIEAQISGEDIPFFILNNGDLLRVQEFLIHAQLVAKRYPVNLKLAGGNVLEDVTANEPIYRDLTSKGFDWAEIMNTQPGLEISPEEYEKSLREGQISADLSNARQHLRVVVRNKKDQAPEVEV